MQKAILRKVRDCMTADPVVAASRTTLPEAYWIMVENDIRRLLVVDEGRLVGIVTMEDLRGAIPTKITGVDPLKVNRMLASMPISQLMSRDPISISPTATIVDAAEIMLENRISTLPVLDADKVVGIVTEGDLFRVLVDICQDLEQGMK